MKKRIARKAMLGNNSATTKILDAIVAGTNTTLSVYLGIGIGRVNLLNEVINTSKPSQLLDGGLLPDW